MLQWMGGSRRKVTTSRKSTYKRQKQYFEQRRRQQQYTPGLEEQDDRKHSIDQYCENNRSLDILSLMNVSTAAVEHTLSCLSEDNLEDDYFTRNNQCAQSTAVNTNEAILVDQSERNDRNSPSYNTQSEYLKSVSINLPNHGGVFVGTDDKPLDIKLSSMSQISVIDLLNDGSGGPNSAAEETSVHVQEPHVAFSVEGLGNVETETPVHSPEMPARCPAEGFFSSRKASKRHITLEHLENSSDELDSPVDVMMRDILFSQYDSSRDHHLCSREIINSSLNHKFFNSRKSSHFNCDSRTLEGVFGNDEVFYSIQDRGRNIWDAVPGFLDDNIDELRGCPLSGETWAGKKNVGYGDYFYNEDCWKEDFNFDSWNLQNGRSSSRRTDNVDITDSHVSCLDNPAPKDFLDFNVSNMRYSKTGTDSDLKFAVNFLAEDTTESLSLLSEESCSSTAVRGDAMKK